MAVPTIFGCRSPDASSRAEPEILPLCLSLADISIDLSKGAATGRQKDSYTGQKAMGFQVTQPPSFSSILTTRLSLTSISVTMLFSTLFAILSTSVLVSAAPAYAPPGIKLTGCPISNAKFNLPAGQTAVTVPSGNPVYIALGVGVQNYTCGSTGTFASSGAVAKLFDISCLVNTPLFPGIQDMVYSVARNDRGQALVAKIETVLKAVPLTALVLGDHYFIPNPTTNGTGLTPVFDFRAGVKKEDTSGFVAVKKLGNTPSPTGSSNVDWLMLQNLGGTVGGTLASTVLRVDTKSGQPPASVSDDDGGVYSERNNFGTLYDQVLDVQVIGALLAGTFGFGLNG
ncbi:hypothetical protein RHS02_08528, partial [Rhizoctonia solani]